MVKKKKKEQKITFQTLIRVLIFAALIYFFVSFFYGQQNKKPVTYKILGESASSSAAVNLASSSSNVVQTKTQEIFSSVYKKIPGDTRNKIENWNKTPFITDISNKIGDIQKQGQKGLDTQIKNVKKFFVTKIYNQVIENIEKEGEK